MAGNRLATGLTLKECELIRSLLNHFLSEGKSISMWRLPDRKEKNIIACTEVVPIDSDQLSIEDSTPGFVVSPFKRLAKKLFLPAETYLKIENGEIIFQHGQPIPDLHRVDHPINLHLTAASPSAAKESNHYQQLVKKCVDAITEGSFEKVVPSRRQAFPIPHGVDMLDVFDRLCELHPQAMVTLVSTPETGTWMGASPELLVQVTSEMIFRTTALASTQLYRPGTDLKTVLWNQKEIEEQALVSRYIINNCFKKIRLREYEEQGPRAFRAGNLLHLKTDFSVDMVATNFTQLGTVMLKLLHPTSAVCGMPLEPALNFLEQHEGYDRELYTGYWGPVNVEQETNLFVNLRCMRVGAGEALLYAGAGVTVDSNPELEWEETVNKMNTMKQVILS